MTKRSVAVAALAGLAVLAAPAAASAQALTALARSSASGTTTFTFRGMNLRIPASWKVHRKGDEVVVTTGACRRPAAFAANCRSFWVLGPKKFTGVPVGGGSFTYTGKYQWYPFSAPVPCPFDSTTGWNPGDKAGSRGLFQIGKGHKAKYAAWPNECVTNNGAHRTKSFTAREWFLPSSKILIIDVWATPGLAGVLKGATWS